MRSESTLQLVIHPNQLLREKSEKVTDIDGEIASLAEAMIEKMHEAKGIGLAGVQVGRLKRMFVTHVSGDKPRVFINPAIIGTSLEQTDYEEGCLSIPGIYSDVIRPESVQIQAWNERGRPFTMTVDGLLARVVQHEFDHLNGVIFLDHLNDPTRERVMTDYDPQVDPASVSRSR